MLSSYLNKVTPYLVILFTVTVYFLPIFLGKFNLLNRGNDLDLFFLPSVLYMKQSILQDHVFPLWNKSFFSGMPYVADPQAPLFYLPNYFSLLLPLDKFFILSFTLHLFFAGLGAFILARVLCFPRFSSYFTAIVYMLSPTFASYLEAGHVGLIYSYAWIPWVFVGNLLITKKGILGLIVHAVSLSALFYLHTPTALLVFILSAIILMVSLLIRKGKSGASLVCKYIISMILTIGLSAGGLFPQLEWMPQTTRFLLLNEHDVYPKWLSKIEFIQTIFLPWRLGVWSIQSITAEKSISVGITTSLLLAFGFLKTRGFIKLLIVVFSSGMILLAANNASPLYSFLTSLGMYSLLRVSTRVWIIACLAIALLVGFASKNNKGLLSRVGISLVIFESLFISWVYLGKPISEGNHFVSKDLLEFVSQDRDVFRVFCTSRCIHPQDVVTYDLELVEGYNTLQQKNYFSQFVQLSQVYWDKYTLSLPPTSVYKFRQIQPNPPDLGDYNVKYVIANYPLKAKELVEVKKSDDFILYKNLLYLPRVYSIAQNGLPINNLVLKKYSLNEIKIENSNNGPTKVIFATPYNSGWGAYDTLGNPLTISEEKNHLMSVNVTNDSEVSFIYKPKQAVYGLAFSGLTIVCIVLYLTLAKFKISSYVFPNKKTYRENK